MRGQKATLRNLFSALLAMKGHSVVSDMVRLTYLKDYSVCWRNMGITNEIVSNYEAELQVKSSESWH